MRDVLAQDAGLDEREKRGLYNRLAEVNEELALYDMSGSYRFLKDRYDDLLDRELKALENCPIEEVEQRRAAIRTIRHLAGVPEILRAEQARLQEQLNEYGNAV